MRTDVIPLILSLLSMGIQLAAAIYALLLIRLTGRRLAWISISVAMTLMTLRRAIAFISVLDSGRQISFDMPELLGLVISFLLLLGVLRIGEYFRFIHSAGAARKKAEEELRDALRQVEDEKGKSEAILEAIGDGITIQDRDYKIIYQNQAHIELTGSHIGELCYKAYRGMERVCEECPVAMSFRDGKVHTVSRAMQTDRGMKYFENTASVLRDSDGEIIAGVEVVRDVSGRRLMEEALQESENKFRDLAEKSVVGIYLVQDEKFRYVNPKLAEIFGYTVAELLDNRGPEDLVLPEDWPVVRENLRKRTTGETAAAHYDFRGIKKDRETIHVEVYGSRTVYKSRPAVIGTLLDVTGRELAEEELRIREKKYNDLFDSTLDGVYQENADGFFVLMNPAGARIFGYERPEEMIGRNVLEYWREPEDREVFISELKAMKSVSNYHIRARKKTGEPIELESSNRIMEDEKGKFIGIEGILRDATERKRLEANLRQAQKMEAVGTLAGGVAHDFNNLLNVIMGYGNLVQDNLPGDSPSRGLMNEVLAAAERAATLVRRLLVFGRKQIAEVKPTGLNELITDIRKMLGRIIGEDIDVQLALADGPLTVMADAGQIEQVLMNLAANARDAMPEGGRLTIGTGLRELDEKDIAADGYGKPGRYALITVSDTGHGMEAEIQKNIFEPFFTTKGIGNGTGLGLAISYQIIKQHDGFIRVNSEPDQGTEFRIYLPLMTEPSALDNKAQVPDSVMGGRETILVAEDDESLKKLTRIVLESFGYSVIMAGDGEDAITKFMENRERIDLILLDMVMPKKGGREASEAIRSVNPRAKILFASGYTMDEVKAPELGESGLDFIQKPVKPQALLKKVREILDR